MNYPRRGVYEIFKEAVAETRRVYKETPDMAPVVDFLEDRFMFLLRNAPEPTGDYLNTNISPRGGVLDRIQMLKEALDLRRCIITDRHEFGRRLVEAAGKAYLTHSGGDNGPFQISGTELLATGMEEIRTATKQFNELDAYAKLFEDQVKSMLVQK